MLSSPAYDFDSMDSDCICRLEALFNRYVRFSNIDYPGYAIFQTIGCIRGEVWRFRINRLHRGGNPIDCSRRPAGMSKQVKEDCE